MKRVVNSFVIASMAIILTGCPGGGDDQLDDPTLPKVFTYTAEAGSGGAINPNGKVSIKQGEDKTFTANPATGKTVNEWIVNGRVEATSGNSYTVTNVQSNGTISVKFKDSGYAPESLPISIRYTFASGPGGSNATGDKTKDATWYEIRSATQGVHGLSNGILSNYKYTKTGANTASFSCSCPQNLPAPTGYRVTYFTGTLTYSSANVCVYEYTQTLNSIQTNHKITFRIYTL